MTPRRNDNRRHDSPNVNLRTRNRSNSAVATTEIGLDVIDVEHMIILQMNALTQSQMIQMVMNQIVQHCN